MKKIIFAFAVLATSFASAQVGVGNTDPKATLDVNKASYATGEQAGIAVTQQTAAQIEAMTTTDLKAGTLVYATTATGTTVNAVGYWNWSGTAWVKAGGTSKFVDGTIPADAVFTGGSVGIGTAEPTSRLEVVGAAFNPSSNDLAAIKVSGAYGGGLVFSEGNNRSGIWSPFGHSLAFASGSSSTRLSSHMLISNTGNIGMGTASPNASAVLDVTSKTQGFLPPRMTSNEMGLISSPAAGLIVYCTNCVASGLRVFDGVKWTNMIGQEAPLASISNLSLVTVDGDYFAGKVMDVTENLLTVQLDVTAIGKVDFSTVAVNGYSFSVSSEFNTTGVQTVIIPASGTHTTYNATGDNFTLSAVGFTTLTLPFVVQNSQPGSSFTTFSNGLGEMFSANTECSSKAISTSTSCPSTVTIDGLTFDAVNINNQCWLARNLQSLPTPPAPCTDLPNIGCNVWPNITRPDNGFWGGYNTSSNSSWRSGGIANLIPNYGLLYQQSAAMNGSNVERSKGVCPTGWHIPSDCEVQFLEHGLGMSLDRTTNNVVDALTATNGRSNSTGFTAIYSGRRNNTGSFGGSGSTFNMLTSTMGVARQFSAATFSLKLTITGNAYSVRCLKDN